MGLPKKKKISTVIVVSGKLFQKNYIQYLKMKTREKKEVDYLCKFLCVS